MPREILTIQCGQCGNQIGSEFFTRLCKEHGITPTGEVLPEAFNLDDRKDVFFYQSDDNHYVARTLLLDLEPRVVDTIVSSTPYRKIFNAENIYRSDLQQGAGNVWASGFKQTLTNLPEMLDMVDREAEGADSFSGFNLMHSIAGGTGSGMGSCLLEKLQDRYPKKLLQTFSVFPNQSSAEVVVQPYNSLLTLRRLTDCADAVFTIDNTALDRIVEKHFDHETAGYQQSNQIISTVMAASTASLRFPGFMVNDMASLIGCLVPTPRLHFLVSAFTPIQAGGQTLDLGGAQEPIPVGDAQIRRTSVLDVLRRLLHPNNGLVSCSRDGCYVSLLNVLQGQVEGSQLHRSVTRLQERRSVRFAPWAPGNVQLAVAKRSGFAQETSKVNGLLIANHTSVREVFQGQLKHFNQLFKDNGRQAAFLQNFQNSGLWQNDQEMLDEMADCRESCQRLIAEYEAAERADYLDWVEGAAQ